MCSSSFNPCCSSHNARLHRTVSIYLLEDVATSRDTDTEACGAIASTNRGFYISLYIIYFSILLLQVWAGWCFFLPIISFPCWQNGRGFFFEDSMHFSIRVFSRPQSHIVSCAAKARQQVYRGRPLRKLFERDTTHRIEDMATKILQPWSYFILLLHMFFLDWWIINRII